MLDENTGSAAVVCRRPAAAQGARRTGGAGVVARRTAYLLRKARERSHILCGLAVAVTNIDEIVATIRASADAAQRIQQEKDP